MLSKEDEATAQFVKETNLTKGQLLGDEIPLHSGAGRKPFVMGEPLMSPELIETLSTRMREFYKWYLKASAEGYIMIAARIKHTHFYWGMDDIWIDFDHFLFLFHQDALDKSPSVYGLCKCFLSIVYSSSTKSFRFLIPSFYL